MNSTAVLGWKIYIEGLSTSRRNSKLRHLVSIVYELIKHSTQIATSVFMLAYEDNNENIFLQVGTKFPIIYMLYGWYIGYLSFNTLFTPLKKKTSHTRGLLRTFRSTSKRLEVHRVFIAPFSQLFPIFTV